MHFAKRQFLNKISTIDYGNKGKYDQKRFGAFWNAVACILLHQSGQLLSQLVLKQGKKPHYQKLFQATVRNLLNSNINLFDS